jgi:hypothetical protein
MSKKKILIVGGGTLLDEKTGGYVSLEDRLKVTSVVDDAGKLLKGVR